MILELSDADEAAAWCGRVLAWAGHHVVKVEAPGRSPSDAATDLYLNEGKERRALDYRRPDDLEAIRALAADADIVVTDAPASDVHGYGLLALQPAPGGVVVSITPYGLDGPRRDWVATAPTLLAHGGYTAIMGDPGRAPLTMPGRYPYYQAGTFASVGAQAALLGNRRSGATTATTIEVSVLECLASLHQFTDVLWTAAGLVRSRHGNQFEGVYPICMLPCADGWASYCILERMWFRFAFMLERPELAEDHPLAANAARIADPDTIDAIIAQSLGSWTRHRIMEEGQETWRVAVAYLASMGELLEHPHLAARETWREAGPARGLRAPSAPFRIHPVAIAGADAPAVVPAARRHEAPAVPSTAQLPLAGVRVLELTDYWAGPLAGRTFGDLGADVILVEAGHTRLDVPGVDDAPRGQQPWNRNPLYNKFNRNERSLVLDLRSSEGHEIFLDLVRNADVVLENFSTRVMPGLGVGHEDLHAANPRLIYVSVSGFGMTGPYSHYVATGPSAEPMTGLTSMMGYGPDEPRVTSKGVLDPMAGTLAASATLTALHRRDATGTGALVELSLQECGIAYVGEHFVTRQLEGQEPERLANAQPGRAPWGVYRCAGDDEWIALTCRDEADWQALCAHAGQGWEADDRFADEAARWAHRRELDALVERWTAGRDKHELAEALQQAGVPAAGVMRAPEWLSDAHLEARGYFVELDEADAGPYRYDGLPIVLDGKRGTASWRPAPMLGEHNGEILTSLLGLTDQDVAAMMTAGVLADRPPAARAAVQT